MKKSELTLENLESELFKSINFNKDYVNNLSSIKRLERMEKWISGENNESSPRFTLLKKYFQLSTKEINFLKNETR